MSQANPDERLELILVQLLSDEYFAAKSEDGSGFGFFPAPYARDWMDASAKRFAYRCLPLTIANQSGYWLTNPVGFTAK